MFIQTAFPNVKSLRKLTSSQVRALVDALRDIVTVLAEADPFDKRTIYEELGVKLTSYPDGRVHVAAGAPHVLGVRVGGTTPRDPNDPEWRVQEWVVD